MIVTIEEEVVRAAGKAPVRRRAPIEAVGTSVAVPRPAAPTGSGKKNTITIRSNDLIAFMAIHSRPFPSALFHQLLTFRARRQTPRPSPIGTNDIIPRITSYISHSFSIGNAILIRIGRLYSGFSPSIIVTIIRRRGSSDIASCPFHTQTQVDILMSVNLVFRFIDPLSFLFRTRHKNLHREHQQPQKFQIFHTFTILLSFCFNNISHIYQSLPDCPTGKALQR